MSDEGTRQTITLYNVSDHATLTEFQAAYPTKVLVKLQFWFQLQHNLGIGSRNKSSASLSSVTNWKLHYFPRVSDTSGVNVEINIYHCLTSHIWTYYTWQFNKTRELDFQVFSTICEKDTQSHILIAIVFFLCPVIPSLNK